jgi:hypothetical protein
MFAIEIFPKILFFVKRILICEKCLPVARRREQINCLFKLLKLMISKKQKHKVSFCKK